MKVVPKLQKGGGFESFFATYVPVQTQAPQQASSRRSAKSDESDSEKGRLTEKDFFTMLKDIDGLPNEMNAIVSDLLTTFQLSNLTGIDTGSLATSYLSNLYQIRVASQNKKTYDEAIAKASKSGSMAEPAISLDGRLVAQDESGNLSYVDLNTYFENPDSYHILTVSNLANLRKYDPQLVNNQSVFDIINNSIGFEEFQDLLDKAKISLGQSEFSERGLTNKNALLGLSYVQNLPREQKEKVLKTALDGIYTYDIDNKDNVNQVRALIEYMQAVLPERAKVWAAWKLGIPDKEEAANTLVTRYLSGQIKSSKQFNIDWKGTEDKLSGAGTSGGGKEEDPKKGFWSQVISGQGGDDFMFTILSKNGRMSVQGKFHGTTPGLDGNKSLGDYLTSSGIGHIIKNNKNITFGDTRISVNSFNDVMVNAYAGAVRVSLPIKADGTVDLEVAKRWVNVLDQLQESGLSPNSIEYNQKRQQLMRDNQLDGLIGQDGLPNKNRFGLFLVLEGYTSEKAKAVQNDKQVGFKDVQSEFIIPAGDDDQLYDMIKKGLSNKDRGEYDLSSGWFGDDLFKGNIYIPLNNNLVSAQNADNNDIKQSTSYAYEKAYQQKSTNSSEL